jgi:ketosteroid isomerase-like protein
MTPTCTFRTWRWCRGKARCLPVLKQLLADPKLSLTFTTAQVEVSKGGDLAYSHGTYSMTTTDPKTKKPVTEKGKYVTVYRKAADGSWKAIQDINNADAPAMPGK